MKKNIAVTVISVLAALAMIPPAAMAEETAAPVSAPDAEAVADQAPEKPDPGSDFAFSILEDGTAQITAYTGKDAELTVPSVLGGAQVTVIADEAFDSCDTLTKVILPEGVTTIAYSAFSSCANLSEIVLPEGLTSIGDYAFYCCSALTGITLPDSLRRIGVNPFDGCSALRHFTVSAGHPYLEVKGGALFDKADKRLLCYPAALSAKEYVIPEGTLALASEAFYGCQNLTSVTIPDCVVSVGENPFAACSGLANISISDSHPVLAVKNSALYLKAEKKMISFLPGYPGAIYLIPPEIREIAPGAFYQCEKLTSVRIPDSVAVIGGYAFKDCSSVEALFIPDSVREIGPQAFYGCGALKKVTLPEGLGSIAAYAFTWCESLSEITLPDGLTEIGDYAFAGCAALKNLSIPESVTAIADSAFARCDHLVLTVSPGSYVEQYCRENNLMFIVTAAPSGAPPEGCSVCPPSRSVRSTRPLSSAPPEPESSWPG